MDAPDRAPSTAASGRVLGLVCCAADGLDGLAEKMITPLLAEGWRVAVIATPTAARWLAGDQATRIETLTGLPIRSQPRLPSELSPHPDLDCVAVVPATANTVAKLALGLADNQALATVGEAIGARRAPVIIFPRVNTAHVGHPAWAGHLQALHASGVRLIYGDDVWPLSGPRSDPNRDLPWSAILDAVREA